MIIYIGQGNYTSEITTVFNTGNILTKETKKYFERLAPNVPITIIAEGINNAGKKIEWGNLTILIKEQP